MPHIASHQYDEESKFQYLNDIYHSILLKDIMKRNQIRDVALLETIIQYIIANIGTTFSATSISNYLKNKRRKISNDTVLNYLKYGADAYLFHQVRRENLLGKQLLSTNEKYYITDHGIREAIYGNNQRDIQLILENIVYIELLRRGYNVTVGKVDNKEIDFVCTKRNKKIYIQVTYILSSEETIQREFSVFNKIHDHHEKFVLSMDDFDFSQNGIRHMNIRDFLLNTEL